MQQTAAINGTPVCPKHMVALIPGKALVSTWVGMPDFIGDHALSICTMSPGGPGKLIDCLKCPECGYSRTLGAALSKESP